MTDNRIHADRVRRLARAQGYRLERSRRRDQRAADYGMYFLIEAQTRALMTSEFGLTLAAIETWLASE